jgi:hypothetical protein
VDPVVLDLPAADRNQVQPALHQAPVVAVQVLKITFSKFYVNLAAVAAVVVHTVKQ